jgi:hypothetical protein
VATDKPNARGSQRAPVKKWPAFTFFGVLLGLSCAGSSSYLYYDPQTRIIALATSGIFWGGIGAVVGYFYDRDQRKKDRERRLEFARFLEFLAVSNSIDRELWLAFINTPYPDPRLEEIRKACVSLTTAVPDRQGWSEDERLQLQGWVQEIRISTP